MDHEPSRRHPRGRTGGGHGRFHLLPLVVVAVLLAACASTPPDRIAYTTLDDAVTGVQTGMLAFNSYYQAGMATEEQRTKVLDAYRKFQAVARAAVRIAPQATAPDPDLVKVALNAASELVLMLRSLTGKP